MSKALIKPPDNAPLPYSFDQFSDESDDEYAAFAGYCAVIGPVTPREYLLSVNRPDLLIRSQLHGWIQRRDAYFRWADTQRRQEVMAVLGKYLNHLRDRLPYLVKREQYMQNLENGNLTSDEKYMEKRKYLNRSYAIAMQQTNGNIELLLKVVKALEPDSGINIQNVIANMPQPAQDKISAMAAQWGEPDEA